MMPIITPLPLRCRFSMPMILERGSGALALVAILIDPGSLRFSAGSTKATFGL